MALDQVAVIGSGAWGTALAQAAAMAGRSVTLYGRDAAQAETINRTHTNPGYLGPITLSGRITATIDMAGVMAADIIILAVPAQASRAALQSIGAAALAGKPVVLSAKGFEQGTLDRQTEILAELAPKAIPLVLSGPSFAADVAAGRPTAVTLAGFDPELTAEVATALAGPALRPYVSDDPVGVELAGGLKNVYALACGAVEGSGLGASARSALLARAYAEMARIVVAKGGSAATLTGLAGLGDLTLSCTTAQSRNYQFGLALGRGQSVDEIKASGAKLAEGVMTAPVAQAMARGLGIDAPLIDAVNLLLAGAASIATIVAGLMARPLKKEE
jgi:glycerol-3-phosphate dehydrogenase (NAD(P)+)